MTNLLAELPQAQMLTSELREKALAGSSVAELLRFLTLEQDLEDQVQIMALFSEAFNVPMGRVTALGSWWHEDHPELDDEAINAYVGDVLVEYRQAQSQ